MVGKIMHPDQDVHTLIAEPINMLKGQKGLWICYLIRHIDVDYPGQMNNHEGHDMRRVGRSVRKDDVTTKKEIEVQEYEPKSVDNF